MKTYSDDLPNVSKETIDNILTESVKARELSEQSVANHEQTQSMVRVTADEIQTAVINTSNELKKQIKTVKIFLAISVVILIANTACYCRNYTFFDSHLTITQRYNNESSSPPRSRDSWNYTA